MSTTGDQNMMIWTLQVDLLVKALQCLLQRWMKRKPPFGERWWPPHRTTHYRRNQAAPYMAHVCKSIPSLYKCLSETFQGISKCTSTANLEIKHCPIYILNTHCNNIALYSTSKMYFSCRKPKQIMAVEYYLKFLMGLNINIWHQWRWRMMVAAWWGTSGIIYYI